MNYQIKPANIFSFQVLTFAPSHNLQLYLRSQTLSQIVNFSSLASPPKTRLSLNL